MAGRTIEIERERSAPELVSATFSVYQRFPLLFLILAAGVVVPYELIVLAITGAGPLAQGSAGAWTSLLLTLIETALVSPLISALHAHAVGDLRDGVTPRLGPVARRSLVALPVVSAAVIVSFLGATVGLIALIVPGVLLWLRWSVAAQAAALERGGWVDALRRSQSLTAGHYGHVFGLQFLLLAIGFVPSFLLGRIFGHSDTTVASFVADVALQIVIYSFTALATALLYYDLTARSRAKAESAVAGEMEPEWDVPPAGHPLDPSSWSDEDRPPGWYVDPNAPWMMRYWAADGTPTWSERSTKTPKQIQAEWDAFRRKPERRD